MRRHEQAFERVIACLYDAESLEIYREVLEQVTE